MYKVYIKYHPNINIRAHKALLPKQIEKRVKVPTRNICVTNDDKHNLNPPHKDLLRCHFIMIHIGFQHVQWIFWKFWINVQENYRIVVNCERPKFFACEFGKDCSRQDKIKRTSNNNMKDQYLNNDNLLSGQVVYLDHYIMRDQCRLYQMGGQVRSI